MLLQQPSSLMCALLSDTCTIVYSMRYTLSLFFQHFILISFLSYLCISTDMQVLLNIKNYIRFLIFSYYNFKFIDFFLGGNLMYHIYKFITVLLYNLQRKLSPQPLKNLCKEKIVLKELQVSNKLISENFFSFNTSFQTYTDSQYLTSYSSHCRKSKITCVISNRRLEKEQMEPGIVFHFINTISSNPLKRNN